MKENLSKKIEATGNPKWSKHLIPFALVRNTQRHSSLLYNMTPYKVFFGCKYRHRDNSLATPTEFGFGLINVTDE